MKWFRYLENRHATFTFSFTWSLAAFESRISFTWCRQRLPKLMQLGQILSDGSLAPLELRLFSLMTLVCHAYLIHCHAGTSSPCHPSKYFLENAMQTEHWHFVLLCRNARAYILSTFKYNYSYLFCGIYKVVFRFAVILHHVKNVRVQTVQMHTSIATRSQSFPCVVSTVTRQYMERCNL